MLEAASFFFFNVIQSLHCDYISRL